MISLLLSSVIVFGMQSGGGFGSGNYFNLCPGQIAVEKPTHAAFGPNLGCGGSSVEVGGVRIHDPIRNCPAFAVIVPAHAATKASKGSGTFTRPSSTVQITRIDFECRTRFFFFIPIGSRCAFRGSSVVSTLTSYKQIACRDQDISG